MYNIAKHNETNTGKVVEYNGGPFRTSSPKRPTALSERKSRQRFRPARYSQSEQQEIRFSSNYKNVKFSGFLKTKKKSNCSRNEPRHVAEACPEYLYGLLNKMVARFAEVPSPLKPPSFLALQVSEEDYLLQGGGNISKNLTKNPFTPTNKKHVGGSPSEFFPF